MLVHRNSFPNPEDIRGSARKNKEYLQYYWPDFYTHLQNKYPGEPIPVQLYMFFNNIPERPKCVCGKPLEYRSPKLGFRGYCSVKCAANSKEVQAKAKQSQEERYGGVGFASTKLMEKTITTMINRYGVSNAMQSDAIKQKQRDSLYESYGVEIPSHSPELVAKIRQTQEERYGGLGMASPELMTKIRQTQEERYGGFGMGAKHMQEKSKQTLLENFGVEYNGQRADVITKSKYSRVKSIKQKYPIIKNVIWRNGMKIYTCHCPHPDTCTRCSGTFEIYNEQFYRRVQDGTELCTKLLPYQHPKANNTSVEVYIKMLLDEMGIKYIQNDRTVINPKEVDFYLPDYKIAIECNGIHWHSTEFKAKDYHINKFKACAEHGIQLISIWEDWIVNAPLIVKSILKSKLGKSAHKLHARKCTIKEVPTKEANEFLFANHIQGQCVSSLRYGLYYNDELVSLMTFGKKRPGQGNKQSSWELIRFCNKLDFSIPGAASRLLKHFIRTNNPGHIISFSSNDISTGNLYKVLGFTKTNDSTIAYWYIGRNFKRHHRFTFCKAKLVKMGYDPSKTETEIMRSLPYYCIYDSGQTKWELNIN